MEKMTKGLKVGLLAGLMSLVASPAFARSLNLKEAGPALWVFVIIGAVIILLQLIPAAIMFFSFIGTTSAMALKRGQKVEEEGVVTGVEPMAVKK